MVGLAKMSTFRRSLLLGLLFAVGCSPEPPTREELLAQAEALLNEGEVTAAVVQLEALEREYPESLDVLLSLAFAYVSAGDPAAAAITFARLAELDPTQTAYLLYAADTLRSSGDLAGASAFYQQYLERVPDDIGYWLTLARFERERGRRTDALTAFLRAQRLDPRGETELTIAELYAEGGNLAQAQTWYALAASRGGAFRADGLMGLFATAMQAERFADAQELLGTIDTEFPGRFDQSTWADQRAALAAWSTQQAQVDQALAALENRPARTREPAPSTSPTSPVSAPPSAATDGPAAAASPTIVVLNPSPPPAETPTTADSVPFDEEEPPRVATITVDPPRDAEPAADVPTLFPAPDKDAEPAPEPRAPRQQLSYAELLAAARSAEIRNEWTEAARFYQRALARNDRETYVWIAMSEAHLQARNFAWAQAAAQEARRRAPTNPAPALQWLRVVSQVMPPE